MPEKLNNDLKKGAMVTPVSTEPGRPDPGPPVLNNPVDYPPDVLGFIPKEGNFKNKKNGY